MNMEKASKCLSVIINWLSPIWAVLLMDIVVSILAANHCQYRQLDTDFSLYSADRLQSCLLVSSQGRC
jgi:hypothetical protein